MNQINKTNQFEHPAGIIAGDTNCSPACEEISVRLFQTIRGRIALIVMLVSFAALWFPFVLDEDMARAAEPSSASLQEQGDGLMKNAEEMVAHGGMGDAKAIIHHCGEATRFAERLIKQLSASDLHRADATTSLNEVIRQCNRVSDIGIHADPGQLLNPATKARAAAQQSIKLLGLTKMNKS
jgi:hypothetical protein